MAVRVTDSNGLVWNATIDDSELNKIAKRIEARVGNMSGTVVKEGDRMEGLFKKLATGAAAFFTIQQATQLSNAIMRVRGEFQQLEIAFGTMLGSKAKADALMAQIVDLAAKTPFGLQEAAQGAKQLLAYGSAAETVTDELRMIGDIASGVSAPLADLVYLYGTLRTQGRAYAMDIRQFAGRGIPIYAELAKVLGVGKEQVQALVEAGKVGFPEVERAFKNMTGEGGMFFNLMEKQSASLTGRIANLKDNIDILFNQIGQSQEGVFYGAIESANFLVENYKEVGRVLAALIATYGAYRTAVILASVANTGWTASQMLTFKWLVAVERAQKILNATMLSNPYVLIATAIAGLVTTMWALHDSTTSAEKAQERLNSINEETNNILDERRQRSDELINVLRSEAETEQAKVLAFSRLQQLYPAVLSNMTLHQFLSKSITGVQKELNAEIEKFSLDKMRSELEKVTAEISRLQIVAGGSASELRKFFNPYYEQLEAAVIVAEKLKTQIYEQEQAAKMAAMTEKERLDYYTQQLEPLRVAIAMHERQFGQLERNNEGVIDIKNNLAALSISGVITQFNHWIGLINTAKKAIDPNAPLTKDVAQKRVEDIDGEIARIDKREKDADKKRAELFRKRREAQKDVDWFNPAGGAKAAESAAKRAETAAKKSTEERTRFLEDLNEAERQFTVNQMVEADKQIAIVQDKYNKMREAAKKAGVKDPGVFQRIDNLEQSEIGVTTYQQDTQALLEGLGKQREAWQQFEEYKTTLGESEARKRFGIERDYLENLISIRDYTARDIRTADNVERLDALNKMIEDESKRRQDAELAWQAQALRDYATYEQKKAGLKADYDRDMARLSPELKAERARQYQEDLAALKQANSEKLVAVSGYTQEALYLTKLAAKQQLEIFNSSLKQKDLPADVRKSLQQKADKIKQIISEPSRTFATTQIDEEINKTQEALNKVVASGDTTSDVFKRLNDDLMRLKQQKADIEITKLSSALGIIAKLAPALQDLANALNESGDSGTWGEIANGIATVAAGASQLNDVFTDLKVNGASTGDAIVAGLQFALNLITTIVSASKRRKAAEEEFYMNAIGLQHEYNLALTEQIRLSAELSENVYLKDYFGRAKAGMKAAIEAAATYQKALDELAKGRAKQGQKNTVDGKTVGQLALSGAATGAVIGTAIGGWAAGIGTVVGTVVGGIVGAISGLFAKKKKDVWGGLLTEYPNLLKKGENGQREINRALAESLLKTDQLDAKTKQIVQNALDQEKAFKAAYDQVREIVADLSGSLGNDLRTALVDAWKAGEDSAKAFGDTVSKVLENILSNLIFHAAFDDLFDKLQTDLSDDFVYGGVEDITESLGNFYKEGQKRVPLFNAALDEMDRLGEQFGLDLKGVADNAADTKPAKNTLTGAYAQASQESIDLLAGHTMGARVAQLKTNDLLHDVTAIANRNLESILKIEQNTGATVIELKTAVAELKGINGKLDDSSKARLIGG